MSVSRTTEPSDSLPRGLDADGLKDVMSRTDDRGVLLDTLRREEADIAAKASLTTRLVLKMDNMNRYSSRGTWSILDDTWQTVKLLERYIWIKVHANDIRTALSEEPRGSMIITDCHHVPCSGGLLHVVVKHDEERHEWINVRCRGGLIDIRGESRSGRTRSIQGALCYILRTYGPGGQFIRRPSRVNEYVDDMFVSAVAKDLSTTASFLGRRWKGCNAVKRGAFIDTAQIAYGYLFTYITEDGSTFHVLFNSRCYEIAGDTTFYANITDVLNSLLDLDGRPAQVQAIDLTYED